MTAGEVTPAFEALLEYLRSTRGFDFTAYKTSSLMRRIEKRMQTINGRDFSDYQDYLEVHPEEFPHLFNTILINVTSFFRDRPVWDYLAAEILPALLGRKGSNDPVRAWSAGCASGQEAYSLAMLLAERLGFEAFRTRVKIYATDVDEEALNQARLATYGPKDVEEVPPELVEKYFERSNTHFVFHRELRRSIIFGRHDLVQDAPISHVDLLISRNTLMYFNRETQARILNHFHFALNDGGYLFLGKAEMLLTHGDLFTPVDLKSRIFAKVNNRDARPRGFRLPEPVREELANSLADTRLREATFESDPVAQLVVDATGNLALANERARSLFGIGTQDVGRPLQDLEVSYRPADLRSLIEQVLRERRPVVLPVLPWATTAGDSKQLEIHGYPLFINGGTILGVRITFADLSRYKRLQDEIQQSKQELETAHEELQSSNEELETTNEELQSSNEELETTNEELQSTNEELETMNEELQSTNEELETINNELRERSDDLNRSNAFLSSILGSLRAGVAVVDRDLRVKIWNEGAEDLWGLRANEVQGQHVMNLDIGLPVTDLLHPIRACLADDGQPGPVTLNATNRRGRAIRCAVTCSPFRGHDGKTEGVILLMETREDGG